MKLLRNTTQYSFELGDERLPIIIRKRANARSIVIRYQPLYHVLSLTLPRYVSIKQGLHFVEEKRSWITRQLATHARHIPLEDGQVIPVLGEHYTLCHVGGRGVVTIDGDRILVHGEREFMSRRVTEWLKAKIKEEIIRLAHDKAMQISKPIRKISLRDTSSHWGSCSAEGNLSFSWRLVFAPYEVLEYLVAHEVAHLAEHNHSDAFWAVVAALFPREKQAKAWLKTHGSLLYAYG